jgi:hypothetical protein
MDATTNAASSPAQPVAAQLPLSTARHNAYRQLALTILGVDVPTLTEQLRFGHELSSPRVRLIAPASRAA